MNIQNQQTTKRTNIGSEYVAERKKIQENRKKEIIAPALLL